MPNRLKINNAPKIGIPARIQSAGANSSREAQEPSMRKRTATMQDLGLRPMEFRALQRLNTPMKIQNFLDTIPQNVEQGGQTCLAVREVLRQNRAHCIEGAMLAACALWIHGEPPLLLDLKAEQDFDHVVTLFRRGKYWGAISKTSTPLLRWRDPVYRSLRELAITYLHEYANLRHQKTLRSYAGPLDLRRFDPSVWVTNTKNCWDVGYALEDLKHVALITRAQGRNLRLRDAIERKAGALKSDPRPT